MQTSTRDRTVATDETDRLISCDKVVGTAVYNLRGEHLGSVYGLMIDKISGQVALAKRIACRRIYGRIGEGGRIERFASGVL